MAEAGHRGDKQTVISGLAAGDPLVRKAAIGAANRLGILDQFLLKTLLQDPDHRVRGRAAELAPVIGGTMTDTEGQSLFNLVAAVTKLLDDDQTAEVGAFSLGEIGVADDDAVRRLEHQARTHKDTLCRESAVASLGSIGTGLATILAATEDVATVRRRALIALASFEGKQVDSALKRALNDRDWQVRQVAEDLLQPNTMTLNEK